MTRILAFTLPDGSVAPVLARADEEGHVYAKDDAGHEGVWRTIRGRRVFIRKGEDLDTALERSGVKVGDTKKDDKDFRTTLRKIEDEIADDTVENGILFDKNGKIFSRAKGNESSVLPVAKPGETLEGMTFTHNHPSGGGFSRNDMLMFATTGLAEFRAVGKNGVFSMTKPEGWSSGSGSKRMTKGLQVANHFDKIAKKEWLALGQGRDALDAAVDIAAKVTAAKYGWKYSFQARKKENTLEFTVAQPLYVRRPVLNAEQIITWAKQQGFETTLTPDDMHVTICYSKEPVDWSVLEPMNDELHIPGELSSRQVMPLGDKGAVVLRFESAPLQERWRYFMDNGASWDYESFHPHVTISYSMPENLEVVEPYRGPIVLGPEVFEPVEEDWHEGIKEHAKDDAGHGTQFKQCTNCSGSVAPTCKNNGRCLLLDNPEAFAQHEQDGGRWVTIDGHPVFIKNARPDAGMVSPGLENRLEELRKQGYHTLLFHGTTAAFDKPRPNPTHETMLDRMVGAHYARDPALASKFAGELYEGGSSGKSRGGGTKDVASGGNVMPFFLRGKGLTVPQPRYQGKGRSGALESDQHAISSFVSGTVLAQDRTLFTRWAQNARAVDATEANKMFDRLSTGGRVDWGDSYNHSPKQGGVSAYLKSYDANLFSLPPADKREVVSKFQAEMKRQGITHLKYQNTSPMETQGVRNRLSYIVLDPDAVKSSLDKFSVAEVAELATYSEQEVFADQTDTHDLTQPTIDYAQIEKTLDTLEEQFRTELVDVLTHSRNVLMVSIKRKGADMLPQIARELELPYAKDIHSTIHDALQRAFDAGEEEARGEVEQVKEHAEQRDYHTPGGHGHDQENHGNRGPKLYPISSTAPDYGERDSAERKAFLDWQNKKTINEKETKLAKLLDAVKAGRDPEAINWSREWEADTRVRSLKEARAEIEELRSLYRLEKLSQEEHDYAKPTFVPKSALQYLKDKAFWAADVLSGGLTEEIRSIIIRGMRRGLRTSEIVTDIAIAFIPYLGDPDAITDGELLSAPRLNTVVRTNTTDAYNQGRLNEFIRPDMLPFLDGIRYSAILDERTTSVCRFLHEKVFKPEDIDEAGLVPPNHFNAVAAGTLITTEYGKIPVELVRAGTRVLTHRGNWQRVYTTMRKRNLSPSIKRLVFASGKSLLATDEHPVLTTSGWKAVRDLQVGDIAFQHLEDLTGTEGVLIGHPENYPSLFDEPAIPYEVTGFTSFVGMRSTVQFESNLSTGESKVDDVVSNTVLVHESDSTLFEQKVESSFRRVGLSSPSFCTPLVAPLQHSSNLHRVVGEHSCRGVRSGDSISPVIFTRSLGDNFRQSVGDLCLLFLGSDTNTELSADMIQGSGLELELTSDSVDGKPISKVLLSDEGSHAALVGQIDSHIDSPVWVHTAIIALEAIQYSGYVYNFAVEGDESYVADGVIIHNCRSIVLPVVVGEKIDHFITDEDILHAQALADVKFLEQEDARAVFKEEAPRSDMAPEQVERLVDTLTEAQRSDELVLESLRELVQQNAQSEERMTEAVSGMLQRVEEFAARPIEVVVKQPESEIEVERDASGKVHVRRVARKSGEET